MCYTNQNILIIRLSALGDVAMTIPTIYSLAQQHKSWNVKVLTQPFFSRIFIDKPENVKLLIVEKKDFHSVAGITRILTMVIEERISVVADFHNVLKSWLIDLFLLLKGKKIGMLYKGRMARWQIIKKKKEAQLFTDRYFDVLHRLGFKVVPSFKPFFQKESATFESETIMIGIAPFARYNNKIYPLEKMKEVVIKLVEKGYVVCLFGSRGEEEIVLKGWKHEIQRPNIRVIAGNNTIEEELKLMSQMKLMVTMDSANMHLASLTGTKVVSIWGSTTPACGFLGYGQDKANAICLGLRCQPCTIAGSNTCKFGTFDCMVNIPPMMIINRINELIKN